MEELTEKFFKPYFQILKKYGLNNKYAIIGKMIAELYQLLDEVQELDEAFFIYAKCLIDATIKCQQYYINRTFPNTPFTRKSAELLEYNRVFILIQEADKKDYQLTDEEWDSLANEDAARKTYPRGKEYEGLVDWIYELRFHTYAFLDRKEKEAKKNELQEKESA